MANNGDDDRWFTRGPVAWFVMATAAVLAISFVSWTFAEFAADRILVDAWEIAGKTTEFRDGLNIAAQQKTATADAITTVLSIISAVFLAVTVWFTRDASMQARKSVDIATRALLQEREMAQFQSRGFFYIVPVFSFVNGNHSRCELHLTIKFHNIGKTIAWVNSVSIVQIEYDFQHGPVGTLPTISSEGELSREYIATILPGKGGEYDFDFLMIGENLSRIRFNDNRYYIRISIRYRDIHGVNCTCFDRYMFKLDLDPSHWMLGPVGRIFSSESVSNAVLNDVGDHGKAFEVAP